MVVKSFWLSEEISEDKVKGIAKEQNRSVSNLINTLLKNNYDVLNVSVDASTLTPINTGLGVATPNNNLMEGAVE